MNHIYSIVWNPALGRFCVTSELGRSRSRSRATTRRHAGPGMQTRLAALAAAMAMAWAMPVWSQAVLPQGGNVVAGSAQIKTAGNQLTVQQGSAKAIVDWQSFNIGKGQQVTFQQPNASSVALNRVVGADASAIHGSLQANGKVFLVNPNGVLFGQGANVDVGGLVASTLNISNERFLNGSYQFEGKGSGMQGGAVINQGRITAAEGGAVALLGGTVSNQGAIAARLGSVALAAGNQVTLDFAGDGLLNVQVSESAVNALAENQQLLQADGGSVLIAAKATDALLQTVVNNTGTVQARTVENREGKIVLLGGFNGGTAQVAGTLDASAPASGDGGFIETSGAHVQIADGAAITTQAAHGLSGTWLIDPNDFTVAATDGNMTGRQVEKALADNGSFTIETATMGTAGGRGDIHINENIGWHSGTLKLNAVGNINVNAVMSVNGTGKLELNYGGADRTANHMPWLGTNLKVSGRIDFSQAAATTPTDRLKVNGVEYKVIDNIVELHDIRQGPGGHYALGSSIEANGIRGFVPIGDDLLAFSGTFDGLGHTINNLVIDRPDLKNAGLFGRAENATLRNVGLVGGSTRGLHNVGALVGLFRASNGRTASISNAYATGGVTGGDAVGGLVGLQQAYGGTASISNAYASGNVSGIIQVGGLVGHQDAEAGTASISVAFASGDVSGREAIGGLVGRQHAAVGPDPERYLDDYAIISDAYATGSVTGSAAAGGLVGAVLSGDRSRPHIVNTYATGAVKGGQYIGGLVGYTTPGATISHSYWNSETTGQAASAGGGTPLTTAQMFETDRWGDFSPRPSWLREELGFGAAWGNADGQTTPYLLGLHGNQVFNRHDATTAGTITAENRPALYTAILDVTRLQGMQGKLDGKYVLGKDIDASATATWNGGQGFMPVGNPGTPFTGIFNGLGHSIDGLTIDRPTQNAVGLFGSAHNATLTDVGLVGGSVSGADLVGALVGLISAADGRTASISNVHASASVTGAQMGGGLVGAQMAYGGTSNISNAYASGNVRAATAVGGLVGGVLSNGGASIANTYATGKVAGTASAGGLVGSLSGAANISNSYWNSETTGQAASAGGGTPLTTAQMFETDRWGNLGFGKSWGNAEGQTTPYLLGLNGNQVYIKSDVPAAGTITADNRPRVYTAVLDLDQLRDMGRKPDRNYVLGSHIDASATNKKRFRPIGIDDAPFTGIFDGLGHTIDGLRSFGGLFGVAKNATLRNVGLVAGSAEGEYLAGGLVGKLRATRGGTASISNVHVASSVTSDERNGGLVGLIDAEDGGTVNISNAYATGDVSGRGDQDIAGNSIGGLVGEISATGGSMVNISNAYASADVSGEGNGIGGLVGRISATGGSKVSISNAYATGAVTGEEHNIGGLVGLISADNGGTVSISNTYATGAVKIDSDSDSDSDSDDDIDRIAGGGLVGMIEVRNGGTASISHAYATGATAGEKEIGGLVGSINVEHGGTASISNAYATGAVKGTVDTGGLVGFVSGPANISNSHWNSETTGQAQSAGGGTAMTTARMFDTSQWGSFGFGTAWGNANGQTTPYLLGMPGNRVFNKNDVPAEGTITTDNRPSLYTAVLDLTQLEAMRHKLDGKYVLGNHIDASATAAWDNGPGFMPIGDLASAFRGTFDGLGHAITGLTIDRPNRDHVGLFGFAENAVLRNVVLKDGSVTGRDFTGALVGAIKASGGSTASISNVDTMVEVTGQDHVGGLAGRQESTNQGDASITGIHALGLVAGRDNVGGLVGTQEASDAGTAWIADANAFSVEKISGRNNVGGLIGKQTASTGGQASLSDSRTMGAVQGEGSVGRLIGRQQTDGTGSARISNVTAASPTAYDAIPGIGNAPAGGAMPIPNGVYAGIEDTAQGLDADGDVEMLPADGCLDEAGAGQQASGSAQPLYTVVGGPQPAASCARSSFSSAQMQP